MEVYRGKLIRWSCGDRRADLPGCSAIEGRHIDDDDVAAGEGRRWTRAGEEHQLRVGRVDPAGHQPGAQALETFDVGHHAPTTGVFGLAKHAQPIQGVPMRRSFAATCGATTPHCRAASRSAIKKNQQHDQTLPRKTAAGPRGPPPRGLTQIGGDETIGKGMVWTRLVGGRS
jgi:hypothetical protein